jgi:uracil-DNA glycosylase
MRLENSWHQELKDEIKKPYINDLKLFLKKEREGSIPIYPPEKDVFRAFALAPFEKVRVVIVGQDPYHGENQAQGLCFSVQRGIPLPPSLKNIFKELKQDLGIPESQHGCLESWAKQGILMLNAVLTVREGQPNSHEGMGWERFTDSVIKQLFVKKDRMIFVLWGKFAQKKYDAIMCSDPQVCGIKEHIVLMAAHPSPFSARNGFFGCKHFSKINNYLRAWGEKEIDWRLN